MRGCSLVVGSLVLALTLAGCGARYPALTPAIAQPNARAARNLTSFSEPLRCMDGLFAQLPRRSYLVSSSDIPDETRRVSVGADDMLINAMNQMNRRSQRYVFLDQARISGFGQLELTTTRKKGEVKPQLYIRGSISQLDSDTVDAEVGAVHSTEGSSGLTKSLYKGFRKLSVVSVDLHLVEYPSRRVVPGASVANSMVVVRRGLNGTVTGIIDSVTGGVPISVERIESQGQAVRNLIELGLIELLGKHAGVPYWQCLEATSVDARAAERRERRHVLGRDDIAEVQTQLAALGYLNAPASGTLDAATRRAISRFQADQNLVPSGEVDFDLIDRLGEKTATRQETAPAGAKPAVAPAKTPSGMRRALVPKPQTATPAPVTSPTAPRTPEIAPAQSPRCQDGQAQGGQECEGIYKNLYDFIKEDVGF